MRRFIAAIGGFTIVALTGIAPAGAAGPAPSLPQDHVTIELEGNETSAVTHLVVSNDATAGVVTIRFIDDRTGNPLLLQHGRAASAATYRQSLAAHTVTTIDLRVTTGRAAVDGHVVVQPATGRAAIATFATMRRPAASWLWLPVAGSAVALVVVLLAWLAPRTDQAKLGNVLGVAADWKFADSWASNISALAAITGTVAGLSGFLDDVLHDVVVTGFVGLNALFLALVAGAPLVFAAGAKRRGEHRLGTVAGFLLASWLTLTAAFGELVVVGLILYMARGGAGTRLVAGLLVAAAVVLVVYGWRSIGDTVTNKRSHTRRGARAKALTQREAEAEPARARVTLL